MSEEFVPIQRQIGTKDCSDIQPWDKKSLRYDYIIKATTGDSDYPIGNEEDIICTPWIHGNAQIDNIQINQTITGNPTSYLGNVTAQQLNVSGISTLGVTTTTNLTAQQLNVSEITTSPVYTASGTLSSTDGSAETFTIDASTTQLYHHSASFNGSKTFRISNLTNGRSVYFYIRNTDTTFSRTISIQASTTNSGYSSVELSRSGSSSINSFTISTTNGTATVWVANIDGNLIGSLS
jgi:hypothetical protein